MSMGYTPAVVGSVAARVLVQLAGNGYYPVQGREIV